MVEAQGKRYAFVVCPLEEEVASKTRTFDDTVSVPAHEERQPIFDLVTALRAAARGSSSQVLCGGLALRELESFWRGLPGTGMAPHVHAPRAAPRWTIP